MRRFPGYAAARLTQGAVADYADSGTKYATKDDSMVVSAEATSPGIAVPVGMAKLFTAQTTVIDIAPASALELTLRDGT